MPLQIPPLEIHHLQITTYIIFGSSAKLINNNSCRLRSKLIMLLHLSGDRESCYTLEKRFAVYDLRVQRLSFLSSCLCAASIFSIALYKRLGSLESPMRLKVSHFIPSGAIMSLAFPLVIVSRYSRLGMLHQSGPVNRGCILRSRVNPKITTISSISSFEIGVQIPTCIIFSEHLKMFISNLYDSAKCSQWDFALHGYAYTSTSAITFSRFPWKCFFFSIEFKD